MKLLTILLSCLAFTTYGLSLNRDLPFRQGYVVFHTGDTLHCELKFTRKVSEGLLQIKHDDHIEILTVKRVKSFSFFDEKKKSYRLFLNLSIRPDLSTRVHEVFVEYVYGNSKLTILNHRTIGFATNDLQFNPFKSKAIVDRSYLLDNETGIILPMSEEHLMPLLHDKRKEVSSYIQSNGMRLKNVDDFKVLLDYHESLL